jgi:hypothetical protein
MSQFDRILHSVTKIDIVTIKVNLALYPTLGILITFASVRDKMIQYEI